MIHKIQIHKNGNDLKSEQTKNDRLLERTLADLNT